MIPWIPDAPQYLYFVAWRNFIRCAYRDPSARDAFSRYAVLAQAQHVMYLAQDLAEAKEKSRGSM
jgi:hypothetical protein